MELIHKLMDLLMPPLILITLILLLPPFLIVKFFFFILRFFSMEDMTGKVVLITGASSGIGEQLAYEYAKRGACLVLVARRENRLKEVAEKARMIGSPDVLVARADVSKVEDCKRFIEEAVNHFGCLDHLVSNAGITSSYTFEETTNITNYASVMDVNFWGSVYPTYFALPHLKKSKGKIVVNASSSGWLLAPRMSFYGASKAALINFYETLRIELDPAVTITIVSLGFTESEITQGKHLTQEGAEEINQEKRDVMVGALPVKSGKECAKAIVNGACRGKRSITDPSWFGMLFLFRVFCPEIVDWLYGQLFFAKPGNPSTDILSKKILDVTGAKKFFYPSSIQSSEIKAD